MVSEDIEKQIHKTGNDSPGWNDQTREINFRDKLGMDDETTADLRERVGEKLPG